ncbi:Polyketide-cyc2 domain containing protein [Pyrenophora tritici-repentis]|nr:hypothetical protein TUN205_08087 [Pyrenophora tritici-repentis]KAI0619909.1 hypothetical protein TUN199_08084 [Pyrenophora tritici-repentis]KAI1533847.1 Polyketide-cyc2 domain containing protein [Pyrenophora tritici-repentis]KAI1537131.1 Polyketide-cyc2 domain containing protein [Pyrenophora tritici-repentis]KAI1555693.1 Polyketide-cyc2 domain containing protein [Pyrenophora tritici-repentis]
MSDTEAWPPAQGLTTKIVPRENAILQLPYSTTIHAPAQLVFDTILNLADYPKWNTWIPSGRILTQPDSVDASDSSRMHIGTTMVFNVIMNASKPTSITETSLKVVDISTPSAPSDYLPPALLADPSFTADASKVYRVSWTGHGGMDSWGVMRLERVQEVIVKGEEECEVRSWEIMGGVMARVVKI